MPLNERFLPRRSPHAPGEKGTPFAQSNGLGRFFVVREIMRPDGQIMTEHAQDERGMLEKVATLAIQKYPWGTDDEKQWYPVTYTVANLAFADTKGQYVRPRRREGIHDRRQFSEYQEQHDLEDLALSRHPEATGVKEIQPVLTPEKQSDMWLLLLITPIEFHYQVDIVTSEELKQFQEQRKKQKPNQL